MNQRTLLIVNLLLGLAIGYCGGMEQAFLGRSIYLVHEAVQQEKPPVAEVRQGLDTCYHMTTVSMYLGVAVGIVAIIGLSRKSRCN
ncbi:MAG: hypothetical protein JNM18_16265 [Planctomycetaceae bacterium]|nr:hypothetical protein [Planctomycetaceae bacterium]